MTAPTTSLGTAIPALAADPTLGQAVRQPRQIANAAKSGNAANADKAARQFEAMFVSQMLQHMFSGIKSDGVFGGGSSEQMFKSMLLDEYGKMIANRGGGIGIADSVRRTLLQGQEVH